VSSNQNQQVISQQLMIDGSSHIIVAEELLQYTTLSSSASAHPSPSGSKDRNGALGHPRDSPSYIYYLK
jgi:hypothetical protein